MIHVEIPGRGSLDLQHLVLDLNGTIAQDGEPIAGAAERLAVLAGSLTVHLASADTRGRAAEISSRLAVLFSRVEAGAEAAQKQAVVERLGAAHVVAIGNGGNDARMLSTAALGIAVLGPEGLSVEALQAADIVVGRIEDALDLLLCPQRLVATLRR